MSRRKLKIGDYIEVGDIYGNVIALKEDEGMCRIKWQRGHGKEWISIGDLVPNITTADVWELHPA